MTARDPSALGEHHFRHESARLVASLSRRFGVGHLADIEDAVQQALVIALTSWSLKGTPDDPGAWLHRVATNALLDRLRRAAARTRALEREAAGEALATSTGEDGGAARLAGDVADDLLRMLFVCCDSRIPAESQIVMALKVLCGFSVGEIALRLFTTEANVYKRLSRAREVLREAPFDLDTPPDVEARLPGVLTVLYLVFNEGYGASRGESLVRTELCEEALRLAHLLVSHPPSDRPEVRALVALFHLHAARLATRIDAAGEILLLADQDRSRWDRAHAELGVRWLTASTSETLSRYHLEAAIAAEHVMAPSFEATAWRSIAALYGLLERGWPSPLHTLNRAIALAEIDGPEAGLAALEGVRLPPGIAGYYLWDAVVGDLLRRAGRGDEARPYLERAAVRAPTEAERALMRRRLAALDAAG